MIIHAPTSGYMNPLVDIDKSVHNLPHWEQKGTMSFVTFRLADSLPAEKLAVYASERDMWLKRHPLPWSEDVAAEYAERFGETIETWLDAGYGQCLLREEANREIVENALRYFNGSRYVLYAFVVMPNHVHVLWRMLEGFEEKSVLTSLKSFTAKAINRRLGRTGAFWQGEYWDRIVRNSRHFSRTAKYIAANAKGMACCAWFAKGLAEQERGDSEKYGEIRELGE